jgi:putative intracellular protease/amidase/ketosteroid isomerase-like protein
MTTTKKILIALTSNDRMGGESGGLRTGYYLPEVAHPWRVFTDAGYTVDLMSVRGGQPPVDGADLTDPVQRAFVDDPVMSAQLERTPTPEEVDARNYDAILFAGGHGVMWDFPGNSALAALARDVYENGGVVAAVCHGPAGLVDVTLSDGRPLVAGKHVAAFTNDEEAAAGVTDVVPFLLETRLAELGAVHTKAGVFEPHAVTDGRLVTGQNPASAVGVAQRVLVALSGRTSPRDVTESYFDAENRRDLEGVLAHFAHDVTFIGPDGRRIESAAALRRFYAENMAALPQLHVELVDEVRDGDRAAVEWVARGRNGAGQAVSMRGTNVISVRDGQFGYLNAYWLTVG